MSWLLDRLDRTLDAYQLRAKVHRAAFSVRAVGFVEARIRKDLSGPEKVSGLTRACDEFVARARLPGYQLEGQVPWSGLLGSRMLVLKSPGPGGEKGVLVIDYSYVFPLFFRLFHADVVAERYHLVLEPSWSGYCALEVLAYTRLRPPVFVESTEPRDTAFLRGLATNLVPVPVSANWWVDHRVFTPAEPPGRTGHDMIDDRSLGSLQEALAGLSSTQGVETTWRAPPGRARRVPEWVQQG